MASFFGGRNSEKLNSILWQSSCLRLQNVGITGMSHLNQILQCPFFERDNFSVDEIDSPVFSCGICVPVPYLRKPVVVRM